MKVRFSKNAKKYYDKLPIDYREKIDDAIRGLKVKPPLGDIRPMEGYSDGSMRLRVGKYRIIFKYLQEEIIEVLFIQDIGPRGGIYK